jgi:hypothetical protein
MLTRARPPARSASQAAFDHVEVICIAFFTAEYGIRLLTSPEPLRFVRQPANLADLAAIAPYFVEQGLKAHGGLSSASGAELGRARLVRIIRLVRVFRLFRMGHRSDKLQVVVRALSESADMLAVLLFLLSLAMILFSTLIFYAEEGHAPLAKEGKKGTVGGGGAQFASIPAAFWWCIVTLMTVGYGDVVPVSAEGKLVAGLTMVASFIILALPISVVGANFTQQWIVYKETTLLHRRAGTLGVEFSELQTELGIHTGVLDEIVEAAATRSAAMEVRARRLRRVAAAAGVLDAPAVDESESEAPDTDGREAAGARVSAVDEGGGAAADATQPQQPQQPPPTPAPSLSRLSPDAASPVTPLQRAAAAAQSADAGADWDSSPHGDSPKRAAPSMRITQPRVALYTAEAELEAILDALARDADLASETFAMAELISSEDFLTRMDAASTKHARMTVMDRKGAEACASVQALLSGLAAERAARPSLQAVAARSHMPGLAAAAAAAAALLSSGGPGGSRHGSSGGDGRGGRVSRSGSLSRSGSGVGGQPRGSLSGVSLATRASQEALDKLAAAQRGAAAA